MCGAIFAEGGVPLLRDVIAVLCSGFAVKLMDDFLDEPEDSMRGVLTTSSRFGRAAAPYAMLLLAIGASMNLSWTVSLFLASYCLGMFNAPQERLPSALKGYQESGLAFALCMAVAGYQETIHSFLLMAAWGTIDAIVDRELDPRERQSGYGMPARLKPLMQAEFSLPVSVWILSYGYALQPAKTVIVSVVAAIIEAISFAMSRSGRPADSGWQVDALTVEPEGGAWDTKP